MNADTQQRHSILPRSPELPRHRRRRDERIRPGMRTPTCPVHKGAPMHLISRCSSGLIAAALLFSLCSPGYSAEYFKWMDDSGELHISDSLSNVPAKYRRGIESKRFEVSKPSTTTPTAPSAAVQLSPVAGGERAAAGGRPSRGRRKKLKKTWLFL